VRLATAEAILTGITGTVLGLAAAILVGRLVFGTARFGATTGQAATWAAASVLLGLGLSIVTIAVPA
jgi:putative ABC transport system permease protein